MENQPDRKDLKIQALLNRVTSTENDNADLRVAVHELTEQVNYLRQFEPSPTEDPDSVPGEGPLEILEVDPDVEKKNTTK